MGTRHIITVIKDGKPALKQYGQWDGYPNYAGVRLAAFIQTYGKAGLEEILARTYVAKEAPDDYHFLEACLGFHDQYDAIRDIINEAKCYFPSEEETVAEEMERKCEAVRNTAKEYGLKLTAEYITRSRDTGYHILHFLKALCDRLPEDETIPVYLSEVAEDAEMIYASYTIDLDNETFVISTHGSKMTWALNDPPSEEVLDRFQEALEEEEEEEEDE